MVLWKSWLLEMWKDQLGAQGVSCGTVMKLILDEQLRLGQSIRSDEIRPEIHIHEV